MAFSVDTTAPEVPSIPVLRDDVGAMTGAVVAGGATDDTTPTLSGTTEAGATVDLYDNDTKIGTVTADENGAWSFMPETPLSDGDHSLTVTSTDAAGNASAASVPLAFTVDTTVPSAPAISGLTDDVGATTGAIPSGGVTDDAMPTLAGTTEAGATVELYDNDTMIGTVTADENGAWSFTPETPLADGDHSLTVTSTDAAGNTSEASAPVTFTVDTSIPEAPAVGELSDDVGATTGAIPSGGVTDDATPTLAGTTEAGATVDLYDNDTKIGTVTADENGAWSFTPETPLADGDHSLTVTSTDAAGNTSEASSSLPFTVDTTAPAGVTGLTVTDDVGAAQGALSDGGVTDDSRPEFGGQAEAGSTVEVYDNGTLIGQVEVAEDGTWRLEPAEALADGAHAFTTVVVDAAGNRSEASAALNVTLDTSAVLVQIAEIVDDVGTITGNIVPEGMTDDATPQINGTGTSGSTITVYDGSTALGTTVVDANGAWSFTPPTALSEGVHSITATATDLNQNVSDPTPAFALTVDTTAPSMPTIDAISDDVGIVRGELAAGDATDDDRPALSGQAEAGAVVDIHDNGAKIGQAIADDNGIWSFTPAEPLAEGAHAFTVTAVDAAGNASAPSSQFAIVTDYTSPDGASLAITDVSDDVGRIVGSIVVGGVTDDDTPTIEGTAAAGSLVTIHVTDSAGARDIGTAMAGADGRWSMVPTVPLLPGENILSAVEMDAAGNASPHSPPYTIVIDKSAPMSTPAITGISDDTGGSDSDFVTTDRTLVIHGVLASALASGHTVEVSLDDGASWQMATVDADRLNWSFDNAASTLADGTYTVHARVVSAAGVNGEETAQAITVDNRGPTNLVTLDLAADSDTGVSSTDNRTSEITPTVQGQVASGSHALDALTVTVFEDANGNNVMDGEDRVLAANIAVEADGNWSASIPSLPPGTYKLMASAVATSGAAGTVASLDGNDARLVIAVDEPQQIHGDTAGFQLGWDVTTAGDFNGDGIDDLLVTSQWADTPGRANSGASYILYGTPGGLPKIHTIGEVTPTTGLKILGSRAGDRMATAINPIGDFNGDGYDDVVLASHWQDKAYVIFGNQTNAWQAGTLDLNAIDAGDNTHGFVIRNPGSTATARGQDSWFGIGAGGGGDFDGDGYKDLLIGNRQAGDSARGEGFLLYGGAGDGTGTGWHNITMVWPAGETSTWQFPAGIRGTVISAPYAGTMGVANVQGVRSVDLGDCINTVGDVNGDGVDDFVISDPRAENVMSYGYGGSAGTAFLIYGRAGGLPSQIDLNTLAATDGIRIHAQHYEWLGSATANESGNAIQALGDINGDCVGDFALAASYSEPGDPGRVWVIYGKQGGYASDLYLDAYNTQNAQVGYRGTNFTSEHGFLIVNEKSSPPSGPGTTYQQNQQTQSSTLERFGSGIRALGDVNGDGIGDFVIGATNADRPGRGTGDDAGAAYVVYGREGGFDASVWSIKEVVDDPSKGLVYRGAFANALLGSGVTIGDWNGDGLSDVAVTADGDDANGTNAGVLNIYYYIPQFTQSFTAGDDVLTATSAKDLLVGGRGNDTIADIGAADYVNGGDGADTVRLASTNFLAVNGGTGVDTLVMDGHGATLDLKALGNRVTGFEIIDLGTNGGNALVVHEDDVKRMGGTDLVATDGNRQMVVRGDATDSVQLVSGAGTAWTDAGTKVVGGIGYHAYISGANEVLTDERVHVTLM
ncbi:Ig-like domain-containing protein [Cupriavidus sp. Marseille-Q8015]